MKWKSCMMAMLVLLTFTACTPQEEEAVSAKPVIYLYPEQETEFKGGSHYQHNLFYKRRCRSPYNGNFSQT